MWTQMMSILVDFILFLDLSHTGNFLPIVLALVFMLKWRISWKFIMI